jgi:hypothetical protein
MDRRYRLLAELPLILLYWRWIPPKDKLIALAGYKVILDELQRELSAATDFHPDTPDPAPILWAPIDKDYLRDFLVEQGADPDDTTRVWPVVLPPDSSSYEGFLHLFSRTDILRYLCDTDIHHQLGCLPLFDLAHELAQRFWTISTGSDKPITPQLSGIDFILLRGAEWGIWPPLQEVFYAIEDPGWKITGQLIPAAAAKEQLRALAASVEAGREGFGGLTRDEYRSLLFAHFGGAIEAL